MQNPILIAIRKVTKRDIFGLFNVVLKWFSPSIVRGILKFLLKDKAFDHLETTDPVLKVDFLGHSLSNPIGLSSGFDERAEVVDELCQIGLGFGELGTYTFKGDDAFQVEKFFRKHNAIFYRNNGYKSPSCKEVAPKLIARYGRKNVVGVSIGEGQNAKDAVDEILKCIPTVAPCSDYIVINLGVPDYIGAKILQNELRLNDLLTRAKEHIKVAAPLKLCPLFLKVPAELPIDAKRVLVERCFSAGVDGLVVSGPVQKVPEGVYLREVEYGGFFSGKPVADDINKLIKEYYYLTAGKIPIIATGGVFSGKDAYQRIRAGASLVQIYSALLYNGPAVIPEIINELAGLLKADGFSNVKEAVGADLRK